MHNVSIECAALVLPSHRITDFKLLTRKLLVNSLSMNATNAPAAVIISDLSEAFLISDKALSGIIPTAIDA